MAVRCAELLAQRILEAARSDLDFPRSLREYFCKEAQVRAH
ncbi:MAG TPA: hypothetical protein VKC58_02010 [Myxococcales bacterium]|jgi:hypothetical protein|nr:hypothetical protein [Myxococcales bacterium]